MTAEHQALFIHWKEHPITAEFLRYLRNKYLDHCISAVNKRFEPDDMFMRTALCDARTFDNLQSVVQSGSFLSADDTAT